MTTTSRLPFWLERIVGRHPAPNWRCPSCHTDNAVRLVMCGCGYAKAHRPEVARGLPGPDPLWRATRADVALLILIALTAWYFW